MQEKAMGLCKDAKPTRRAVVNHSLVGLGSSKGDKQR